MVYDGIKYKDMSDGMKRCHTGINKYTKILLDDPWNEEAQIWLKEYKDVFKKLKEMHSVNGVYPTGKYDHYKYPRKKKKKITDEEIDQALSNLKPKEETNANK